MFRTALISMFITSTALATTWTVDDDGKADFDNIQAAVDAASDGDEIVVMPGTYTSTAGEVVNMLGKEIWLHSSAGAELTFIDGESTRRCITLTSGETSNAIVEGLTIRGGYSNNAAGGIFIESSNPTMRNCIVTDCYAVRSGGGVLIDAGNPSFTDCIFKYNRSGGTPASPDNGGGVYCNNSFSIFTNCSFINNQADDDGGGMFNHHGSLVLTSCTFKDNSAGTGGGLGNIDSENTVIADSTFCGNSPDQINGDWTDNGGNLVEDECECLADINGDGYVNATDLLAVIDQWGKCPNCPADINNDGNVDVTDILEVIALWGDCQVVILGACVLQSQTCIILEESDCNLLGGMGWIENGSCADSDGDRIPNDFELGDCSIPSGAFSGSDPYETDTDGDGINDGDESYGTLAGLELNTFGCNPCRKDILVETDWVYANGTDSDRNKLHLNQVNRIVSAFSNAPVMNVDGTMGIKMHIDYGQSPYNNGNSVADANGNSSIDFDTWVFDGEYPPIKSNNFNSNRHGYFHYCVLADAYSVGGTQTYSSGLGQLPGDDFVATMGAWTIGDDDRIGNTFVHELGHNLNIRHGGFENRNWKPNYNSVMNYRHQFCGVDTNGDSYSDFVLDYSRGTNISLDEDSLDETVGVTGFGPAIDWDEDGNANETNVTRNINCSLDTWYCGPWDMLTQVCGSGKNCYDSTCDVASDNNDWANIYYHGITDNDLASREIIHCIFGESKIVKP